MKRLLILLVVVFIHSCSKSENNPDSPVDETENTAPSVPVTIYPTNGLLCIENPIEFSWNSAIDKEGDEITYEIEIASDESFTNLIEKTTVNETKKTFTLEKGIELNWRVRAKDNKNNVSDFSTNWKFYTEGEGIVNYLPFKPTLLNPILNSTVTGNSVSLEWSSSDVDGDELVYDLYFGNSNPPSLFQENISDNTYSIGIIENQIYYWKIIVKDGNGGEAIGNVWNFKS
ncbi:hypothetical protein GTQ34_16440 [Muricauda sp. JGD-17]|uniref:Fibronectin type-III domain-containing protein n=1 Tax=Flagellimonas ochracea TaxID=2696472 RepID=A0A964TER1_9FLAO|nr:hypothetical protein [Allomuricauda ochracea]NAY93497.1 hypothetical protein [Allomuricauda ochracea]